MYTPEAYTALVKLFRRQGYCFVFFDGTPAEEDKCIYLRHDVDYSPHWAAQFAKLDSECGVTATFCFQLRSPLYNLASAHTTEAIRQIQVLGHNIALHFSFVSPPRNDPTAIAAAVAEDYELARAVVPTMKPWFSWHNPSLRPGLIDQCLDLKVQGMVNLYSRTFVRDSLYRSDSNWRYTLDEWRALACADHRRLHLLFHPFQWMAGGSDMHEVLAHTYAEFARSARPEFYTNHIWRKRHQLDIDEQVYAEIPKLFIKAGDADR